MTWWQWMIGVAEMALAFWGTRWLTHPDHREERLAWFSRQRRQPRQRSPLNTQRCSRCGWPITASVHTRGMCLACEQTLKRPTPHTCVYCHRRGSLGSYADDGTGWTCVSCVHARLPEKVAIWHTERLKYLQTIERGKPPTGTPDKIAQDLYAKLAATTPTPAQRWAESVEGAVEILRPESNRARWDSPAPAWFSLCVTGKDGRPVEATERQVIDRWPRQSRSLIYYVHPGRYDWIARSAANRPSCEPVEYARVHCVMKAAGEVVMAPNWSPTRWGGLNRLVLPEDRAIG